MEEKRYYWIKLTDRFITSDTVDFLMSQPNGAEYVVLYQMLCLKTVNTGGELARHLGEIIVPYDAKKIQRDCKYFSLDTITVALHLYKQLGLVYESEEGILKIANYDRLIGSEGDSAERVRNFRARRALKAGDKGALHCNGEVMESNVTQKKDSSPTPPTENTEKEKDKDKETQTDKDITPEASDLSVGQSESSLSREGEDGDLTFYHDFLIEHLDGERKEEFCSQDGQRFRNVVHRLKEMRTFSIGNNSGVPCWRILKALTYFVAGPDGEDRITEAFTYIDGRMGSGQVKNELAYTITTLYQMACNRGYAD